MEKKETYGKRSVSWFVACLQVLGRGGGGLGTPLALAVRHMGDPASRELAAAPTSLSAGAGPAVTILVLPGNCMESTDIPASLVPTVSPLTEVQ